MQSSTHSSQINTVGPAISFLTSCWLLPQKEQYSVFFESPLLDLVIATPSPAPHRAAAGLSAKAPCPMPSYSSICAPDGSTTS